MQSMYGVPPAGSAAEYTAQHGTSACDWVDKDIGNWAVRAPEWLKVTLHPRWRRFEGGLLCLPQKAPAQEAEILSRNLLIGHDPFYGVGRDRPFICNAGYALRGFGRCWDRWAQPLSAGERVSIRPLFGWHKLCPLDAHSQSSGSNRSALPLENVLASYGGWVH